MTKSTFSKILIALIAAAGLACAPNPVFAQRGGHGGGGGFHGGGGGFHGGGGSFHGGGGGFHGGGGGFHGGGHYTYRGGFRGGVAPRMGNSYGRSGGFASPSYGNSVFSTRMRSGPSGVNRGRQGMSSLSSGRFGSSAMAHNLGRAAPARADGQWHSFGRGSSAGPLTAHNFGARAQLSAHMSGVAGSGWHSFGERSSSAGPLTTRNFGAPAQVSAHMSGVAGSGWHSFGNPGNASAMNSHSAGPNMAMSHTSTMGPGSMRGGSSRSFGRSPVAGSRAMLPFTSPHTPTNSANFRLDRVGFGNSAFGRSSFGGTSFGSSALGNSRFGNVSLFGGSRFGNGFRNNSGANFFHGGAFGSGAFSGSRFGFNRFPGSRFGCFRCGFGSGFLVGSGFGGWGFGGFWGPWWGPWWGVGWWGLGGAWDGFWGPYWPTYPWWGWPAPYYAYPPPPPSGYGVYNDNSGYSDPGPSSSLGPASNLASASQNGEPFPSSSDTSPVASNIADNAAKPAPTVVVYLNDGTMYEASDYWVADNQLHYVANRGREATVDLDQVDVQRTVDENAKRGTQFTLKADHAAPATGTEQTQENRATSADPSAKQNNEGDAAQPTKPNPASTPQVKTTSQTETRPQG